MAISTIGDSIVVPSRLVFLMWLTFSIEFFYRIDLSFLAVYPREPLGLIGIFTAPIVHGNLAHVSSNTIPVLFLGTTLYFFYPKIASTIFMQCYFFPSILVWIFGRSSFHLGASGLVYGLAAFMIFFGLFRKDMKSLLLSLVILSIYWTLIFGVVPNHPGISWESHLFGGITGAVGAFLMRKNTRY